MINPVCGRIVSSFGKRLHPITKIETFHNGIDIVCKCGTPILAPDYAVVTEVWDHERGGRSLAIETVDGIRFGFAHLQKRLVKVGEPVLEGQKIAYSGDTGQTTGPHLHFTMKKDGQYINPEEHFDFRTVVK